LANNNLFNESLGQLLRQRRDGELVLDGQERSRERFESYAHAKEALFDYIEVFL
jgi:hypothetical protein